MDTASFPGSSEHTKMITAQAIIRNLRVDLDRVNADRRADQAMYAKKMRVIAGERDDLLHRYHHEMTEVEWRALGAEKGWVA